MTQLQLGRLKTKLEMSQKDLQGSLQDRNAARFEPRARRTRSIFNFPKAAISHV